MLRSQVRGGKIFGAFNEQEREHILTKLLSVNGLIPSLHTFFKDLQYLQACVDCVKRLISLSPGQTLFNAMECAFTGIDQRDGQVMLQIAGSEFIYRPGTVADQVSLGYQQIHAHAMRNFLATPKEPQGENIRAIPKKEADKAVLRKFAELAQWLGFESLEITTLKEYLHSTPAAPTHTPSKPVLVTSGRGEIKSRRCGLPRKQTYEEDSEFLYLNNLYGLGDDHGEGLTSFFIRRSVFFAFYGRHIWTNTNSATCGTSLPQRADHDQTQEASDRREEDTNEPSMSVDGRQNLQVIQYIPEQHALHQERLEQERLTEERMNQERQEHGRQEHEKHERLQQELHRQECLEREWQEQQERKRQEQLERERQEQPERERQQQQVRQEQLERERREQQERELRERLERERQEQQERERQEQLERERQEHEKHERLQQELHRQESLDRERQERERGEQLERERQEQLERERREQQGQEGREQMERERQEQLERETQEQQEREKHEQERQEQQKRLDQARMREAGNRGTQLGLDKLLSNSLYDALVTSGNDDEGLQNEGNQVPKGVLNETVAPRQQNEDDATRLNESSQSTQEDSNTPKIRIIFKIWERGNWRDMSDHLVDPSDPSEIERVANNTIKKKIRPFDTNLRRLTPQDCFEAATANGTNTIFLIPETDMNIINGVAATASDIRVNMLPYRELGRKRVAVEEISERHHIRKKQIVLHSDCIVQNVTSKPIHCFGFT